MSVWVGSIKRNGRCCNPVSKALCSEYDLQENPEENEGGGGREVITVITLFCPIHYECRTVTMDLSCKRKYSS